MNERRFVVTDHLWQRPEPYLPGKASGEGARHGISPFSRSSLLARSDRFSMARPIARQCMFTCMRGGRPLSATGTTSSGVSVAGPRRACPKHFSRPCAFTPTSNTHSSTALLFRFTDPQLFCVTGKTRIMVDDQPFFRLEVLNSDSAVNSQM